MARVLLDTNVILDYLCATRPCHAQAVELLYSVLESPDGVLVVSASSLKDVYYIMCRCYHDEAIVRERLHDFLDIVELEGLTRPVVEAAFASDEPDLEDGLVRATAELSGVDAIITRDVAAFADSPVPAMDAAAYLAR